MQKQKPKFKPRKKPLTDVQKLRMSEYSQKWYVKKKQEKFDNPKPQFVPQPPICPSEDDFVVYFY